MNLFYCNICILCKIKTMTTIYNGIKNFITGSGEHSSYPQEQLKSTLKADFENIPEKKDKEGELLSLFNELEMRNSKRKVVKKKSVKKKSVKKVAKKKVDLSDDEEEEIDVSEDEEENSPLEKMIKLSENHYSINKYLYNLNIYASNVIKNDLLDFSIYNRMIDKSIVNDYLFKWDEKYPCNFTLIYRKDKDKFEIADGQHRYCALMKMPIKKQKNIIISLYVYICSTDKAARDYIRGCNNSHPFEISCIDEYRLPQIIEDFLKHYPNTIKKNRPYINKNIFQKKLMKSDIYKDVSFSSEDIVNKIVKINDILLEMAKDKQYCTDKKTTKLSKDKATDMKMLLGLDQEYRWMYFLDQNIDMGDIKFKIMSFYSL